jgi:hypothetical protein
LEVDEAGLVLHVGAQWADADGVLRQRKLLGLVTVNGHLWSRKLNHLLVDWKRDGAELSRQVVNLAGEFLADPEAAFARSADHCCVCGKTLTEPLSRSRGIGPECMRHVTYLRWLYTGRRGDPPPVVKPPARKPPQGRVLHSNESGTELEYAGPAKVVEHSIHFGRVCRRETAVRWVKTEPPHPSSRRPGELYVGVLYKLPGKRKAESAGAYGDRYVEILDADGAVLWDSRRVVPGKAEWEVERAGCGREVGGHE